MDVVKEAILNGNVYLRSTAGKRMVTRRAGPSIRKTEENSPRPTMHIYVYKFQFPLAQGSAVVRVTH